MLSEVLLAACEFAAAAAEGIAVEVVCAVARLTPVRLAPARLASVGGVCAG